VDTEDALLIAHRDHSQDVGKIVKELGLSGHTELV
jgi:mannose-1-phosphate guanylyltransferase